ncbi:MAG: hypothetical protein HQ502_09395 [Alphaproteobacteria bacterium]|nr:hypothetical protein [Alphaproteobacteria bacterium]
MSPLWSPLAGRIVAELEQSPRQFHDVVEDHMEVPWPDFLKAWGEIRAADILSRDDDGAYMIAPACSNVDKAV